MSAVKVMVMRSDRKMQTDAEQEWAPHRQTKDEVRTLVHKAEDSAVRPLGGHAALAVQAP